MRYTSTRDRSIRFTSAQAIACGLSRDGGLFVPESVPALPQGALEAMKDMTYRQRAVAVMRLFMEDFTDSELESFCAAAYGANFDTPAVAPVRSLDERTHFLELWHGPTCAFKDMALQILPHFLTASLVKNGEQKRVCILVATSGDTGKAALEGFRDVDRTKIMVFYPRDGVSDIQKLQMTSQGGDNVGVCAVVGNFDDAQNGVKRIFSDGALRERLAEAGWFLSSANSINWGRLLPQIVYYISAYCDLLAAGKLRSGEKINFCVPTGNFGDILAGYYARAMGLPVGRLICASNRNDVLTDFFRTGVYDRNRPFHTTISPSMDILISSNLERLLFELSGGDDKLVASYMRDLAETGRYTVSAPIRARLDGLFAAGSCTDEETKEQIGGVFRRCGYLMDTHTAVASRVLDRYRRETGDGAPCVVVSTASPYKFSDAVLSALGDESGAHGLDGIDRLQAVSGTAAPEPLLALRRKSVRFTASAEKADMLRAVEEFILK